MYMVFMMFLCMSNMLSGEWPMPVSGIGPALVALGPGKC